MPLSVGLVFLLPMPQKLTKKGEMFIVVNSIGQPPLAFECVVRQYIKVGTCDGKRPLTWWSPGKREEGLLAEFLTPW